jgi:hypothetical protein
MVRILTAVLARMTCGTLAGIQTDRCGGTTHSPVAVRIFMIPRLAKTSWPQLWKWGELSNFGDQSRALATTGRTMLMTSTFDVAKSTDIMVWR